MDNDTDTAAQCEPQFRSSQPRIPGKFAERLLSEMPARPANYESTIALNAGVHPFDPELETGGNSCAARLGIAKHRSHSR